MIAPLLLRSRMWSQVSCAPSVGLRRCYSTKTRGRRQARVSTADNGRRTTSIGLIAVNSILTRLVKGQITAIENRHPGWLQSTLRTVFQIAASTTMKARRASANPPRCSDARRAGGLFGNKE